MILQRRDIPPVLLMLLLVVLVMLTLSQILVVHNGRYGRNIHNMRKLQLELREMDINLHSLMMQNVPSIELNRRLLQNEINAGRIKAILAQASKTERRPRWTRRRNQTALTTRDTTTTKPTDKVPAKVPAKTPMEDQASNPPPFLKAPIKYCPAIPPGLQGRVFTRIAHSHNYSEAEIIRQNPELNPGGTWRPEGCAARHKVAVIVPYRDRKEHLRILLSHLHPILQRQQLDYTIFVVEQYGKDTFNKARIMNIAFVEALKLYPFQCFVFHDVDLVPEDDRNMYSCPTQPRHMSVAIDEMGYKLAYQELVGGVLNLRTEHFQRVNGYSNLYWGWGAEDDDMAYRIMHVGLKITRPPEVVARYKMIRHTKRKPADWRKRAKLLYTGTRRFQFDGLNSLQYRMVRVEKKPLFTHILVDIGKPPRGF